MRFHIPDNRQQSVDEVCHGLACLDQLCRAARTFVPDEVRECLRIRVRVPKCETADLSKVVDAEIFTFRGLTETARESWTYPRSPKEHREISGVSTVSYCTKKRGDRTNWSQCGLEKVAADLI
jgi:hypothetical protein